MGHGISFQYDDGTWCYWCPQLCAPQPRRTFGVDWYGLPNHGINFHTRCCSWLGAKVAQEILRGGRVHSLNGLFSFFHGPALVSIGVFGNQRSHRLFGPFQSRVSYGCWVSADKIKRLAIIHTYSGTASCLKEAPNFSGPIDLSCVRKVHCYQAWRCLQ